MSLSSDLGDYRTFRDYRAAARRQTTGDLFAPHALSRVNRLFAIIFGLRLFIVAGVQSAPVDASTAVAERRRTISLRMRWAASSLDISGNSMGASRSRASSVTIFVSASKPAP